MANMRFLFSFSLLFLLSSTANSKDLDPLECKKLLRAKYNKGDKQYQIDVPKVLFIKDGYCSKPFKKKVKNNDKVG